MLEEEMFNGGHLNLCGYL